MKATWTLMVLLTTAGLAGCTAPAPLTDDGAQEEMQSSEGSASLYVQDAPTDEFAEIHVVFTSVEVHRTDRGGDEDDGAGTDTTNTTSPTPSPSPSPGENGTTNTTTNSTSPSPSPSPDDEGNGTTNTTTNTTSNTTSPSPSPSPTDSPEDDDTPDGPKSGWIELWSNPSGVDVDLLEARDNRSAFLGETNLSIGTYTQIRMHVAAAYGIDHDGERHGFKVPSGKVRYVTPFDVHPDSETRIVLDIDLDQSLRQQGSGWMLHPVVGKTDVALVAGAQSGADVHSEGQVVNTTA